MTIQVAPGDVLAVLGSRGMFSKLIRFSAWLQRKPDHIDHVVIVTHQDRAGRWLGISGQPGGVAICDLSRYLNDPLTNSNNAQPRPDDEGQTQAFLASCARSLGIAYDWVTVVGDTLGAFHLKDLSADIEQLWQWPTAGGELPGHVVCSSLAAMLYEHVGWDHPDLGNERVCQPADWSAWNEHQAWNNAPA